eukprot:220303-Amphidinium_carterae.1
MPGKRTACQTKVAQNTKTLCELEDKVSDGEDEVDAWKMERWGVLDCVGNPCGREDAEAA